jgi:hypothetical protein
MAMAVRFPMSVFTWYLGSVRPRSTRRMNDDDGIVQVTAAKLGLTSVAVRER